MNAPTIVIGLVLLVLLYVAGKHIYRLFHGEPVCCQTDTPAVPKKKLSGEIVATKIADIEGMTCGNCKNRVEMLLDDIDGAATKVNLHYHQATIRMTRDVSDDEIRKALDGSGYTVKSIRVK